MAKRKIFSTSNGKVLKIKNGVPGDGNTLGVIVIYDEENNISHRYVHCEANSTNGFISRNGAKSKVTKGQQIAWMGNTGTDPIHLHYETIVGKTTKYKPSSSTTVLDPLTVFPQLLISMDLSPANHGNGFTSLEKSYYAKGMFSQRYQFLPYDGGGTRVDLLRTAFFICKQRGIAGNINEWTLKVLEDAGIDTGMEVVAAPPETLPLETFTFDGDFKVENSDITGIWGNIKFFDTAESDSDDDYPIATETLITDYIKTTKTEKNIKETFLVGVGLGGQVVTKVLRSFNGIDKVGLIDPIPYYKFTSNPDLSPANIPQKINSIMYYGSDLNRPFSESHWNVIKNSGLFTTEVMLDDAWDEATNSLIPKSIPVEYVWFDTMVYFFKKYGGKVGSNLTLPPPPIYPFPNKVEGNKFREWVNDEKTTEEIEAIYPDPEFGVDKTLGRSGDETGRYVEQAWSNWGVEYEATL